MVLGGGGSLFRAADPPERPGPAMKPQAVPSTQEVWPVSSSASPTTTPRMASASNAPRRGHRDLVTVVGHAAGIAAGEWITASGEWVNDRTHGQQFKAQFVPVPRSAAGVDDLQEIARLIERGRDEALVLEDQEIGAGIFAS
jgi:hypothetical protein